MTTPISNTTTSALANNTANRAQEREQRGQTHTAAESNPAAVASQDDAISVSRAAELLSKAPAERGQGGIESVEQAAAVVQTLKSLLAADPAKALAAQGGVSAELMDLLKAG